MGIPETFLKATETEFYTIDNLSSEIQAKKNQLELTVKKAEIRIQKIIDCTLSCKQICEALRITEPTLIKRRNQGRIPFIKIGDNYRYLKPTDYKEGGSHE